MAIESALTTLLKENDAFSIIAAKKLIALFLSLKTKLCVIIPFLVSSTREMYYHASTSSLCNLSLFYNA